MGKELLDPLIAEIEQYNPASPRSKEEIELDFLIAATTLNAHDFCDLQTNHNVSLEPLARERGFDTVADTIAMKQKVVRLNKAFEEVDTVELELLLSDEKFLVEGIKSGDIALTSPPLSDYLDKILSLAIHTTLFKDNDALRDEVFNWAIENGREAIVCAVLKTTNVDMDVEFEGGDTLFHLAATFNDGKAIRLLINALEKSSNPNAWLDKQNDEGKTALHYAAQFNNVEAIEALLAAGSKPALVDHAGYTPLYYQSKHKDENWQGEALLREATSFMTPATQSFREMKRERKQNARQFPLGDWNEALSDAEFLPQTSAVFAASIFSEDPKSKERFLAKTETAYKMPLLRHNMDVLALWSRQLHEERGQGFGVFLSGQSDVKEFKPLVDDAWGLYTQHNSAFISAPQERDTDIVWGTINHEIAHGVMKHVFDNYGRPYKEGSPEQEKFSGIVSSVLDENNLNKISANTNALVESVYHFYQAKTPEEQQKIKEQMQRDHKIAFDCIKQVTEYSEAEYPLELIVRIPEIIASLGYEKGHAWLQENVPALLDYYEQDVCPAITEHLREHNVDSYLSGVETNEAMDALDMLLAETKGSVQLDLHHEEAMDDLDRLLDEINEPKQLDVIHEEAMNDLDALLDEIGETPIIQQEQVGDVNQDMLFTDRVIARTIDDAELDHTLSQHASQEAVVIKKKECGNVSKEISTWEYKIQESQEEKGQNRKL